MTTKDFIESKGMSRNRNVKVKNQLGRVLHRLRLDDLLEEYHQEQLKLLNIPPVICYVPTKRDYFTAMAMQGLLSGRTEYEDPQSGLQTAVESADLIIEKLK